MSPFQEDKLKAKTESGHTSSHENVCGNRHESLVCVGDPETGCEGFWCYIVNRSKVQDTIIVHISVFNALRYGWESTRALHEICRPA